MWTPIVPVSFSLLDHVVEPAARSLALACFAGLALAVLRVKAVSLRTAVWRGVLVAALAMPLLGLFAPQIRLWVPLPQFDARATTPSAALDQPVLRGGNQAAIIAQDVPARVDSAAVNGLSLEEAAPAPVRRAHPLPWALLLMCSYLSILFLLLARVFAGAALAHRLARSAIPAGDAAALRELAACCRRTGLKTQPLLAESENVLVPVTVRVRRPAILLPASWREWENDTLAAVIAHEVSHIRRRDPLVQRLALIHRAIFWFSPLGWWLERHLAGLAEQSSDEAALSCGVERARYAEMLLGFVASLQNARSRISWEGVAMAKCSRAEKRIDRILAWRNAMPNELKKSLIVALALLAAPVIALTASVHPSIYDFSAQEQAAPPAPQAPAPPAQPSPAAHPVVNPGPPPQAPPAASALPRTPAPTPAPQAPAAGPTAPSPAPLPPPAPQVAPAPSSGPSAQAMPPLPATAGAEDLAPLREQVEAAKKSLFAAQQQVSRADAAIAKAKASDSATAAQLQALDSARAAHGSALAGYEAATRAYRAAVEQEDEAAAAATGGVAGGVRGGIYGGVYTNSGPRFVIVRKNSNSVIMSGSSEDQEHAKVLRSKISGDFIWFERDEKPYIIRDQATVDRALKLWEPQEELGRQQAALGKQQALLGQTMENLGKQMEEVRVKIPDLSAQMEKLEARMKELSANGGTMEQIGDLQGQIGELQSRIGQIQSEAGRRQSEIGRQQSELGRKQGELGRQQGELGRRQGELARQASQQMKQLLDDAIAKGLAQPE